MKKHFLAIIPATVLASGLLLFGCVSPATTDKTAGTNFSDGGLTTLRGSAVATPDRVPVGLGMTKAQETSPFDRNFLDQPPMVPHRVDDYVVDLNKNRCMECHSVENHRKEKTTRVPTSHFVAGDGKTLASLASRRYFCLQCHVPQIDANPLVENTFRPAN